MIQNTPFSACCDPLSRTYHSTTALPPRTKGYLLRSPSVLRRFCQDTRSRRLVQASKNEGRKLSESVRQHVCNRGSPQRRTVLYLVRVSAGSFQHFVQIDSLGCNGHSQDLLDSFQFRRSVVARVALSRSFGDFQFSLGALHQQVPQRDFLG